MIEVEPNRQSGIGLNTLPESIRNSKILSRNNLQQLISVKEIPFIDPAFEDDKLKNIFQYYSCVLFVAMQLHSSIIMNG